MRFSLFLNSITAATVLAAPPAQKGNPQQNQSTVVPALYER